MVMLKVLTESIFQGESLLKQTADGRERWRLLS
jgi:hypothetical protein